MAAIPARLARLSQTSGSWPGALLVPRAAAETDEIAGKVARARSRALYRDWMRAAHEIPILYAVNIPASAVRAKIRQDFERNLLVDDLGTVDILLLKGHQEYQVSPPATYCRNYSYSRPLFAE